VASFFPTAVHAAADGNPLYFVAGGFFGLLPDTLDFKFYRFFYRHDMCVVPDPADPSPQQIADAVACAVERAMDSQKPVSIKLETIRLASDLWQQYRVRFDVRNRRVTVSYGPVVDTGRNPVAQSPARATARGPCLLHRGAEQSASSALEARVRVDYQPDTVIDIFDGPVLRFIPESQEVAALRFIPWHREWSHSIIIGAAVGTAVAAAGDAAAGAIAFGALAVHAATDQLGFMGSSLWFPLHRRRRPGSARLHSTDPLFNFSVVWLCFLLIYWNLSAYSLQLTNGISLLKLLFWAFLVPFGLLGAYRNIGRSRSS
jgi:hypothetical protein